ncbi:uncharacterized protein [Rutidosis leptorrhynchoides]|uniref:uncharacterized protein n=1 Tax=Rutidosis leptorrhynchoides TaxID=125765 RepID=UPI003A9A217F
MIVEVPRLSATLLIAITLLLWFTTIYNNQPQKAIIEKVHIQQNQDQFLYHLARRTLHDNRALPPPVKFNFSLFVSRQQHHRKFGYGPFVTWSEIDSRYDVEMHLVPTGPNPLHH